MPIETSSLAADWNWIVQHSGFFAGLLVLNAVVFTLAFFQVRVISTWKPVQDVKKCHLLPTIIFVRRRFAALYRSRELRLVWGFWGLTVTLKKPRR